MNKNRLLLLVQAALIAALYAVLTLLVAPVAFRGPIQLRISEALMLLAAFSPAAVIGLPLGCFVANLLNPDNLGPIDQIFGAVATGLAAVTTYYLAKKFPLAKSDEVVKCPSYTYLKSPKLWLYPLPSVIFNALIVGTYLPFLLLDHVDFGIWLFNVLVLGVSEALVVYVFGLILYLAIWNKRSIFEKVHF